MIRAQWKDEEVKRQGTSVWDKHFKSKRMKIWLPLFVTQKGLKHERHHMNFKSMFNI